MKYGRTFNFSAGPAMMPEPVLEEIRDEMMNYRGSGMCVMEMSHRSKVFQQIIDEAEADLRELMNIPDNYKVLFIQGGATYYQLPPWRLDEERQSHYCIETGAWSKRPLPKGKKYSEVIVAASSKDKNYSYISRLLRSGHSRIPTTSRSARTRRFTASPGTSCPTPKGHVHWCPTSPPCFLSKPCPTSPTTA